MTGLGRDGYDRVKAEWAQMLALLDRPHTVLDEAVRRLQPDGLILGRRHQPLAHEVIPARISLDGSLPSCWPQASQLWRATIPAALAAPTRETNDMTTSGSTSTSVSTTHTLTSDQAERAWAIREAREVFATQGGSGMFNSGEKKVDAGRKDLVALAEWLIGERDTAPEPVEESADDVVHARIHELTPEQALSAAMHGFQHAEHPLVVAGDLGRLAELDDDDLEELVNGSLEKLSQLPQDVKDFRERNPFGDTGSLTLQDVLGFLSGSGVTVSTEEGSLAVDLEKKPEGEQAEGGDNRTPETDAVVDAAEAQPESGSNER